jgi:hypothetical protein
MSALRIQKCNVTARTLRRWCAKGRIEGACKDSNGHWHLPPLTPEQLDAVNRAIICDLLDEFRHRLCPGLVIDAMLATAGFPDCGFAKIIDSSKFYPGQKVYRWQFKIPRKFLHLVLERDPLTMLRVKAQGLRLRGIDPVETRDLANILGFKSVQTLYNRYGQQLVRAACQNRSIFAEGSTSSRRGHSRSDWVNL